MGAAPYATFARSVPLDALLECILVTYQQIAAQLGTTTDLRSCVQQGVRACKS